MLLLALQWGGEKYKWSSATVIGLLCGFAVLTPLFWMWQLHEQDEAGIPPKIFMQRTVFSSAVVGWFAFGGLQLVTYYLPIWFQVILGASPTKSGVYYLPSVLGDISASVMGGVLGRLPFPYSMSSAELINGLRSHQAWILQPFPDGRNDFDFSGRWLVHDLEYQFRPR